MAQEPGTLRTRLFFIRCFQLSWVKRSVFLAFDADITSKFDVRKALFRTFLLLANEEADVFHVTSWDPDAGKGIDDYLASSDQSPEEVVKLLIADKVSLVSILEKTPSDLRLVEEELKTVMLKRLARSAVPASGQDGWLDSQGTT